ncbi:hypothetical protein [Streptomonospora litoralis]|uniref:Uncharacterized protein n=1 Tax=Streptomonospora litoralis TaxID=2498135 RepID=A0A4P6Q805_9ACTN|nr:hypothetical protein [Streptomonospora litoralis]QBI56845.1 hypothetical protein EKD16_25525 [Streptomonospora litoralis]
MTRVGDWRGPGGLLSCALCDWTAWHNPAVSPTAQLILHRMDTHPAEHAGLRPGTVAADEGEDDCVKHDADPRGTVRDPVTGLTVDTYPVGVLHDLLVAYRTFRYLGRSREAYSKLGHAARGLFERARAGQWREVRTSFNGYLAEPTPFPAGLTRCGSGWTRAAALRSLRRHYRRDIG